MNIAEDVGDKEAIELEADKRTMINCIMQKILLASKFEKDN